MSRSRSQQNDLLWSAARCFRLAGNCDDPATAEALRQQGREYLSRAHRDGQLVDDSRIMALRLNGAHR